MRPKGCLEHLVSNSIVNAEGMDRSCFESYKQIKQQVQNASGESDWRQLCQRRQLFNEFHFVCKCFQSMQLKGRRQPAPGKLQSTSRRDGVPSAEVRVVPTALELHRSWMVDEPLGEKRSAICSSD